VQYLPILLGIVRANYLFHYPTPIFQTTVSAIVRCCGTGYLPICSKYKLLLVLNPAAGVSSLIMNMLINHTVFMESRHFVIVFIFVVIRFN